MGAGKAGQAARGAAAERLKGKAYEKELAKLHVELVKLQEWFRREGLKDCVVFEGRDGAGKGGVIKAITERVSPRVFRVVALAALSEREKSQMYVQRYIAHFPAAGEVVIFDRSWYKRAGVERVMGFCSEEASKRFLGAVPFVEQAMISSEGPVQGPVPETLPRRVSHSNGFLGPVMNVTANRAPLVQPSPGWRTRRSPGWARSWAPTWAAGSWCEGSTDAQACLISWTSLESDALASPKSIEVFGA